MKEAINPQHFLGGNPPSSYQYQSTYVSIPVTSADGTRKIIANNSEILFHCSIGASYTTFSIRSLTCE